MDRFKSMGKMNRRKALNTGLQTAAGLGIAGVALAQTTIPFTAQEKANIQVIDDLFAAWNAKDAAKVQSFFAEDARFSVGQVGKTPLFTKPNFGSRSYQSVSMVVTPGTTWARGPVVTHERTDNNVWSDGRKIAGKYIAVFTLRDGKIVDFIDFEFERPRA